MSNQLRSISVLVEKAADWDKDERYMALNDMSQYFNRDDVKITRQEEGRVVSVVLKALTDPNNDVKSAAVKCVGILVHKVDKAQIETIINKLTELIRSDSKDNSALRDIYGIALKTLIEQVDQRTGSAVATLLVDKLLLGVDMESADIKRECLSVMEHLLRRFGAKVGPQQEMTMKRVLRQLSLSGGEYRAVRKLSADVLGALAVVSSDELLDTLVETILGLIDKTTVGDVSERTIDASSGSGDMRSLIQTIGTISRLVGHRLSRHLKKLVPFLLAVIGDFSSDEGDEEQDLALLNEVRELCFSGLESFVKCCPDQIAPHLISDDATSTKGILSVAMTYLQYDPNYVGDDEADEGMDLSDDDYGDDYDDDDYGDDDDDDTSWKVRRAASNAIRATIHARWADMHGYMFDNCVDELVKRFKERKEAVRVDIMQCIIAIVDVTEMRKRILSQASRSTSGGVISRAEASFEAQMSGLRAKADTIVTSVCKCLGGPDKELDTKSTALSLMTKLMSVLGAALPSPLYSSLMDELNRGLVNDKCQPLRLSQMHLLRQLITFNTPQAVQTTVNMRPSSDESNLFSITIAAIQEAGYKNVAEALLVAAALIPKLRPVSSIDTTKFEVETTDYTPAVRSLYGALYARLSAQDIDQEIKRYAIQCTGTLFFHFGDRFSDHLPGVLSLLSDKLDNEVTRVSTLHAIAMMSRSPCQLNLAPILSTASLTSIALFLKQQARDTRHSAVHTLTAIIGTNSSLVQTAGESVTAAIVKESANLIGASDLHLASEALGLLEVTMSAMQTTFYSAPLKEYVFPRVVKLAASPFLHGSAQEALVGFLQKLVSLSLPGLTFASLFDELYKVSDTSYGKKSSESDNQDSMDVDGSGAGGSGSGKSDGALKQEAQSVAYCVAGMCVNASAEVIQSTVEKFVSDCDEAIAREGKGERRRHLALLCLGNLGKRTDLAKMKNLDLEDKIMACFSSANNDTQTAAAFALGNLSVGNMKKYLPLLLRKMECQDSPLTNGEGSVRYEYLLLVALREIILAHATNTSGNLDFGPYLSQVVPVVMPFTASTEMGERNVAAECMGLMTFMQPTAMLTELDSMFAADFGSDPAAAAPGPDKDEASAKTTERDHRRWSLATAMRFAVSRELLDATKRAVLNSVLVKYLPELLGDENIDVCKAAVMLLTSVIHRNRDWIHTLAPTSGGEKPVLDVVFPKLMTILAFKRTIEVDTGPFKFKEDLGLPLRKATLTCLDMMMANIPDDLNITALIPGVMMNMGDELKVKKDHNFNDLKIHAMQVVVKLAAFAPGPLVGFVEASLEVLKKSLEEGIKETATATDRERALDLKRACLKVVLAYSSIEGVRGGPVFKDFYDKIQNLPFVPELYREMSSGERTA